MNHISKTAIIYPNVKLGDNITIEEYSIVGIPPTNSKEKNELTIIGNNAVIRAHTIIYSGNIIGKNFQTGNKANIRENNTIGDNVSIGTLSVVEHHVTIEDNVRIHTQVFVPEYSTLKKDSWLGPNVVLTNAKYPKSIDVKETLEGPIIEEGAKIGANATLLPGVKIGSFSLIGAGSVVTKNIPGNEVHAGNPAKFIKKIDDLPYE